MQELNLTDGCLNENSDPYGIFIFAINSQVTKQKYTYRLAKFFDFINLEGENIQQRCRIALEKERKGNSEDKWLLNNSAKGES
ncbi:MAG: hypothetical protein WBQ25_11400 [Nitrososphaeraceae archaeon]